MEEFLPRSCDDEAMAVLLTGLTQLTHERLT
jgi:hypothetical protein